MGLRPGEEWVADALSIEALRRHVEALCRWHRVSGQPGEAEAGRYLVSALETARIPHEVHEFEAYVSYPIEGSLELDPPTGESLRLIAHSFGASTAQAGATAPLVDAGDGGTEAVRSLDLRGKIAVVWDMALPWTVARLQEAGAVGQISVCRNRLPHEMCLSPVWGSPEAEEMDRLPRIPVLSTDESGGRILQEALRTRGTSATLRSRVWTGWARLVLPVAHIRTTETTHAFVLIGSHYDSWYQGATDTATTDALLLEIARGLWARRAKLRHAVRIAWWPGHSQGRYAGSAWYADRFWRDLRENAIAYLNLDGSGAKHASRLVLAHTAELQEFSHGTVTDILGWPVEEAADEELVGIRGRPARNADQSFLGMGVPSLAAYSEMPRDHPDRGAHAAASGGGWWWHTPEDTPDKVDYEILRQEGTMFLAMAYRLASSPVLPLRVSRTVDDLLFLLQTYAEAARGVIDFAPILEETRKLREYTGQLEATQRDIENRLLVVAALLHSVDDVAVRLTRILNPVLYSTRGPFRHDPAMPSTLLPGLRRALELPSLTPDEQSFVLVRLRREMNRLEIALEQAKDLLTRSQFEWRRWGTR